MRAEFFVAHRREEMPRWRRALPDALRLTAAQTQLMTERGDRVWLMTDEPQWKALTSALAGRGVIVVIMALEPNGEEAQEALQAGARGYVHALSPMELLRQVALVTGNQGIWVPTELLGRVLGSSFLRLGGSQRLDEESLALLTERERAVALAVAEGASNKEAARRLGITERTVKAHLGAVFRKLGVRDRMQLVLRLARELDRTP